MYFVCSAFFNMGKKRNDIVSFLYKVFPIYFPAGESVDVYKRQLLNEPCLSVTEIAELLNFADQSYLSRFFKKNTGISPKEFRLQKLL